MGTNYYISSEPPCSTCGRGGSDLHIGKSSAGWRFLFASYPALGLASASDWERQIEKLGGIVHDEYGSLHTQEELFSKVERKQSSKRPTDEDFSPGGRGSHEYDDADGYRISRRNDFC